MTVVYSSIREQNAPAVIWMKIEVYLTKLKNVITTFHFFVNIRTEENVIWIAKP